MGNYRRSLAKEIADVVADMDIDSSNEEYRLNQFDGERIDGSEMDIYVDQIRVGVATWIADENGLVKCVYMPMPPKRDYDRVHVRGNVVLEKHGEIKRKRKPWGVLL